MEQPLDDNYESLLSLIEFPQHVYFPMREGESTKSRYGSGSNYATPRGLDYATTATRPYNPDTHSYKEHSNPESSNYAHEQTIKKPVIQRVCLLQQLHTFCQRSPYVFYSNYPLNYQENDYILENILKECGSILPELKTTLLILRIFPEYANLTKEEKALISKGVDLILSSRAQINRYINSIPKCADREETKLTYTTKVEGAVRLKHLLEKLFIPFMLEKVFQKCIESASMANTDQTLLTKIIQKYVSTSTYELNERHAFDSLRTTIKNMLRKYLPKINISILLPDDHLSGERCNELSTSESTTPLSGEQPRGLDYNAIATRPYNSDTHSYKEHSNPEYSNYAHEQTIKKTAPQRAPLPQQLHTFCRRATCVFRSNYPLNYQEYDYILENILKECGSILTELKMTLSILRIFAEYANLTKEEKALISKGADLTLASIAHINRYINSIPKCADREEMKLTYTKKVGGAVRFKHLLEKLFIPFMLEKVFQKCIGSESMANTDQTLLTKIILKHVSTSTQIFNELRTFGEIRTTITNMLQKYLSQINTSIPLSDKPPSSKQCSELSTSESTTPILGKQCSELSTSESTTPILGKRCNELSTSESTTPLSSKRPKRLSTSKPTTSILGKRCSELSTSESTTPLSGKRCNELSKSKSTTSILGKRSKKLSTSKSTTPLSSKRSKKLSTSKSTTPLSSKRSKKLSKSESTTPLSKKRPNRTPSKPLFKNEKNESRRKETARRLSIAYKIPRLIKHAEKDGSILTDSCVVPADTELSTMNTETSPCSDKGKHHMLPTGTDTRLSTTSPHEEEEEESPLPLLDATQYEHASRFATMAQQLITTEELHMLSIDNFD